MNDFLQSNRGADSGLFGVPLTTASDDCAALLAALRNLWEIIYNKPISAVEADMDVCRSYFDPVARGHKLRDKLATLEPPRSEDYKILTDIGEPLVTDAGGGALLVGVEGRLVIEALVRTLEQTGECRISPDIAQSARMAALRTYRAWSHHRITQVLDLRRGQGAEVLQATAVGIVLTLLVNRSTSAQRAIGRITEEAVRKRIDRALHEAAGAFADKVAGEAVRSQDEQRLIKGHWLTEARRRLAHRLVVTNPKDPASYVYIPEEYKTEVVDLLGKELARRSAIRQQSIEDGFDALVRVFRSGATTLAGQGMMFERPADTVRLRQKLIESFQNSVDT